MTHHATAAPDLLKALWITAGFAIVEALAGWWSGSLALLSDAGHMISDALALGLAAFAGWVAQRPATARHSYGYTRAEVIAALVNGALLLAVIVGIVVEAIRRLQNPQPVMGGVVVAVAVLGMAVNVAVAMQLSHRHANANVRAALLHVTSDLLGSVAALIAGAVIYFTGWLPIDALLSLAVAALILYSAVRLLREALHVLMEGVPMHLDISEVEAALAGIAGVKSVHDLHIWTLSHGIVALSAHLEVSSLEAWSAMLDEAGVVLRESYGIEHATLQPEVGTSRRGKEKICALELKV
ncbi:MAG: cation diffusion facilitator family transporter [Burkholderiales bacterium]